MVFNIYMYFFNCNFKSLPGLNSTHDVPLLVCEAHSKQMENKVTLFTLAQQERE